MWLEKGHAQHPDGTYFAVRCSVAIRASRDYLRGEVAGINSTGVWVHLGEMLGGWSKFLPFPIRISPEDIEKGQVVILGDLP
jgi:hypothetical protein